MVAAVMARMQVVLLAVVLSCTAVACRTFVGNQKTARPATLDDFAGKWVGYGDTYFFRVEINSNGLGRCATLHIYDESIHAYEIQVVDVNAKSWGITLTASSSPQQEVERFTMSGQYGGNRLTMLAENKDWNMRVMLWREDQIKRYTSLTEIALVRDAEDRGVRGIGASH